ncbi:MAG: hypothetical protein AAFQ07_14135, partial [Chloroflexota bacterium]
MYEFGKRYTVNMPQGMISSAGIKAIADFINAQRLTHDAWKARNPDEKRAFLAPLPDDWDYRWVVTGRGEYVGTFPKRVSNYYWQTFNIRTPQAFVQDIGQIARRHSEDNATYTIDFTDKLDWDAGDYGD